MATSGWATSTVTGFLSSVPGLVDSGLKDANDDDSDNTNDEIGGDNNTIKSVDSGLQLW